MEGSQFTTITNRNGCRARFLNIGARWTEMHVPDANGNFDDVLLGFACAEDYLNAEEAYHGAVVGRYCGRISGGKPGGFSGLELVLNEDGKHHLHGGINGFHLKNWQLLPEHTTENSVGFYLLSKSGQDGYPGDLEVTVIYTLTDDNQLILEARATTTQTTLVNLTNHAFFNLSGRADDLGGHQLWIDGDLLVQDEAFLLTGELVAHQKLQKVALKDSVSAAYLLKQSGKAPSLTLWEPTSMRFMKLHTNQIAVQLYNGFFMTGADTGKTGESYYDNSGLAIEPQYLFPDRLNTLNPGEIYHHRTAYEFGTGTVSGW